MPVKILYHNYPLIAKEKITLSSNKTLSFCDVNELKEDLYNIPSYASFEGNFMSVDKKYEFYESGKLGWICSDLSGPDGTYSESVWVQAYSPTGGFTSDGLTLYFSPNEDEYPPSIHIIWRVAGGDQEVYATPDSNVFYIPKHVENFSCLSIYMTSASGPNRYARLYRIDYGQTLVYEGDSVYHAELTETADVTATQISENYATLQLKTKQSFQLGQKTEIYFNGTLMAYHTVKSVSKLKDRTTIETVDLLAALGSCMIPAATVGVWQENHSVGYLVNLYIQSASGYDDSAMPIVIDSTISDRYIHGCFDSQISCRNALLHICFAAGGYIDTSRKWCIYIKDAFSALTDSTVSSALPETDIFEGDSTEYKTQYKYITVKYKNAAGEDQSVSVTKPAKIPSSTRKEITACFTRQDSAVWSIIVAQQYYFSNAFYKAKSIVTTADRLLSKCLIMDDFYGRAISLKYNLDGSKLIADAVYKVV